MTLNIATQQPHFSSTSIATRKTAAQAKRRRSRSSLRARVAAAFRKAGCAVAEKQAYERTKRWYRDNGEVWAQSLA